MKLDRESGIPLHTQLENMMRQKISSGEWPVGKLMPSENKISTEYGVSRMTVRNVITRLEQDGLVKRVMGKGTYVSSLKMRGGNLKFDGIISQLQKMGYTITTKVLSVERITEPSLATVFLIPEETLYYKVQRVRYMNSSPMSVHVTYVPAYLVPSLEERAADMEQRQLFIILENDYGLARGKVTETWQADKASKWIADILQIKTNQPILVDHSVTYNLNGRAFVTEAEYFRGDKISLYFEFQ